MELFFKPNDAGYPLMFLITETDHAALALRAMAILPPKT
jgi:hypothetical protein